MSAPPLDPTDLRAMDELDRYWERHMLPLIARLEQKYPHLFADDFVVANDSQALPTPIVTDDATSKEVA